MINPINKLVKPKSKYRPVKVSSSLWAKGKAAGAVPPAAKQAYYDQVMKNQRSDPEFGSGRTNTFEAAKGFTNYQLGQMGAGQQPPQDRAPGGPGGPGGGGWGGGGGGGGGGPGQAELAQGQLDFLMQLLGNKSAYTAPRDTVQRGAIGAATKADLAAAQGAYGGLDKWLAANRTNPYADVKLQNARLAPDANPYLTSQGVAPVTDVTRNPEDVGANAAFSNVLKLLGAGERSSQASRAAESKMGHVAARGAIGAADNAMLAAVAQQEAAQQQALNTERRQAMLQLAALVGQGAKAPNLANFKW